MQKKLLAWITVLALAVSAMGMTAFAAETEGNQEASVVAGEYTGSYTKESAMAGTVVYTYSVAINEDGSYIYKVSFPMRGDTYEFSETGTYEVEGDVITFTQPEDTSFKDGGTFTGTLENGVLVEVTRYTSPMASAATVHTFGTGNEAEDEKGDAGEKDDTTGEEDTTTAPAAGLESGKYAVDLTWVPFMDAMLDPVLEIDAENGTFKVYNAATPDTLKGNGTITADEATGEYTLVYEVSEGEEAKETTFTYDAEADTVTFTSALIYGSSSFNNTDEATGEFVPYAATLMKDAAEEGTGKDDAEADTENGKDDAVAGDEDKTDDTTENAAGDSEEKADDVVADKESAPKTSDNSPVALYSIAALAALGAAIVFAKKRNA